MRNTILLCTSIIALTLLSCSDKRPALNDIHSQMTTSHINIEGTRLFIVPPKGFSIAGEFTGLIRDPNCKIQIIESKGEKIRNAFPLYADSAFTNHGKEILESKRIRVNEYPGKLIVVPGKFKNTETLYLLFGDNTFSAIVIADYQTVEKKTREEIYHALQSLYFERSFTSELSTNSPYFFADEQSRYKFCEKMEQFDVYTVDGELKAINSQEPLIMVMTMKYMKNVALDKVAEMNRLGMVKMGATAISTSEISHDPINGYEALSRKISFSLGVIRKTSYQAFVKHRDQVVLIQGIVFDKDIDKLDEIKQFTSSVTIR